MAILLSTEDGKTIVSENLPGLTGASTLNDISVQKINKETFSTNPVNNGWQFGTDWEWDNINFNMKII